MNNHELIGLRFLLLGVVALMLGLLFGVIGSFQFLYPEFLQQIPFFKSRPLHVSLVVAWIFLAAIGGIYYYLPNRCGLPLYSRLAAKWHFWIFLLTGIAILGSYLAGHFGGREYLEFPKLLGLPIFIAWILFAAVYFKTVRARRESWPVYFWMWGTGIFFFLLTFTEAYLWTIPFFREHMVRELSVQWKAYGSLIGAWNMMVYGTAIYVAENISDDKNVAYCKLSFSLYFLGLGVLMFGWSHHTYLLPTAPWIRHLGYAVSMAEIIVLGKIIWDCRTSLATFQKCKYHFAYWFLFAAEIWIFLNIILALLMSVPAFNIVTHGTHITVAHAMASTIGINTMILLASVFFIIKEEFPQQIPATWTRQINIGFWLSNGFLFLFVAALIAAGLGKGFYEGPSFQDMMLSIRPFLLGFAVSGVGVMLGLWLVLLPACRLLLRLVMTEQRGTRVDVRSR